MPSGTLSPSPVSRTLANWDFIALPGLCGQCGDSVDVVPLPFPKATLACHKCFQAICYGM